MTNCRFVNCIDISLIFQCVLLPFLPTHFISDLPLLRRGAHVLPVAAGTSVCIINSSDYAEKNTRTEQNKRVCFAALCIFLCTASVIRRYEAILCAGLCLHLLIHALWFRVLFLWKCHLTWAARCSEHTPFLTHCYCIVFMWNGS